MADLKKHRDPGLVLNEDTLFLKQLVERARDELLQLDRETQDSGRLATFQVESMTIKVNVVITQTNEGKAGFDLKVITAGTKASYQEQQVHKVTVSFGVAALFSKKDTLGRKRSGSEFVSP